MKVILLTHLSDIDPDVYKVIVLIFILILAMRFINSILGKILNHKLKNKILDKGISKDLATAILQTEHESEKHSAIKWIAILLSTGVGLFITDQSPLGIHSIGIMAISIAFGFIIYSFYLKHFDK